MEFRGSEVRKVRVLVERSGVGGVRRGKKQRGNVVTKWKRKEEKIKKKWSDTQLGKIRVEKK